MTQEVVSAQWVEGEVFLLKDQHGFPLLMTQPRGVKGSDLLPLGLIGCAAWDVAGILKKQRQPVERLAVSATSERDAEPPWKFRKIHIVYRITGKGIDAAAARRAVDLAQEKHCSVYATLRTSVELTSEIEFAGGDHG